LEDPDRVAQRDSAPQVGFAFAQTNTGHDGRKEPGYSFVMSNPQKALDYAYRAVNLTAVTAKALTRSYYGKAVARSYWNSCSNGGRQGLIEAQRYPQDFDGALVNSPWVDQTGFTIGALWNQRAVGTAGLTAAKMVLIGKAVMEKCDAADGLKDGLIDDPRQCKFDAKVDVPATYGWADTILQPLMGVNYRSPAMAPTPRIFFRLFMVPGMGHCGGGIGTDRFDAMTPLIDWVEKGKAPGTIRASQVLDNREVRSRPLLRTRRWRATPGRGASTTPRISIAPTHDKHLGSLDVASAHLASNRRRIYGASCSSSTPVWLVFEPGRKTESPKPTSWRRTARPSPHQSASSPTWRAVVFPGMSPVLAASRNESRKVCARLLPRGHCWAFRITKLLPPRGASARGAVGLATSISQKQVDE
jgi:hypothetical protein